MTINRYLRLIAGFFIMLSVALSQLHSPYWLFFTALGLNLFQSFDQLMELAATVGDQITIYASLGSDKSKG